MIIECPACQSRYRIREEKLPAGGGNIKCPNCAHVFFVNMPAAGAPPVGAGAQAAPVPAPPPVGGPPVGGPPVGGPPVAAGGTMMMAPPPPIAAAAPGPVVAPITGVNAAIGQKWKLKNQIGLIYDFADTESLRRWLQAREALDGLQASRDNGTTWDPLDSVEELRDIKATGRKTVAGMAAISGGVDPRAVAQIAAQNASAAPAPPPNPEVLREQAQARLEQARKTRDGDGPKTAQAAASGGSAPAAVTGRVEKQKKAGALLRKEETKETSMGQTIGAVVILVAAIGVFVWGLNSAGIIRLGGGGGDASTSMPSGPAPTPPSALAPPTADAGAAPAVGGRSRLGDRERAAEALDRASTAMNTGDNEAAIGYLERAAYLDPENRELACQLALLYLRQNRTEEAAAARRRCEGADAAPAAADEAAADPGALPPTDPGAMGEPGDPTGAPDDSMGADADPAALPSPEPEEFEGPNIVETRIITGSGSGSTAN